jgi:hypothetical protein
MGARSSKRCPKGGNSSPDQTGLIFHLMSLLRGRKGQRRFHEGASKEESDAHRRHRCRPNEVGRASAQSFLATTPCNRSKLQLARTPLIWLPRRHHTKATTFLVAGRNRRAPTPEEGSVSTPRRHQPHRAEMKTDSTSLPPTKQRLDHHRHRRSTTERGGDDQCRPSARSREPTAIGALPRSDPPEPPMRPPRPPIHPVVSGPPP